jgi:hypothetical protein
VAIILRFFDGGPGRETVTTGIDWLLSEHRSFNTGEESRISPTSPSTGGTSCNGRSLVSDANDPFRTIGLSNSISRLGGRTGDVIVTPPVKGQDSYMARERVGEESADTNALDGPRRSSENQNSESEGVRLWLLAVRNVVNGNGELIMRCRFAKEDPALSGEEF